jgi:transcriptional regulator with XRE-family HTH domain
MAPFRAGFDRSHLEEPDMMQTDFGSRIGVSQSYLSAVERGRGEVGGNPALD